MNESHCLLGDITSYTLILSIKRCRCRYSRVVKNIDSKLFTRLMRGKSSNWSYSEWRRFKSNKRHNQYPSTIVVAEQDSLSVNPSLVSEWSILAIAGESEMLTVSMVLVLMRVKSSHIWTSSHYRVRLNVGINVSCQRKHWKLFSNICQNKTCASSSRILITNFLITFSFCLFLWKIPSLELALIECEEC